MGLENIVSKYFEAGKWLISHPKTSGITVAAATFFHGCLSPEGPKPDILNVLNAGFYSYLSLKVINEYVLGNRDVVKPPKNASLVQKAEHFVFNNPSFFSLVPGTAAYLWKTYSFDGRFSSPNRLDLVFIPLFYPISHFTLNVRKANELFTRAYEKLKSKNYILRISDFIIERPMISAGAVGLGFFYNYISSFKWGMENTPISSTVFAFLLSFVPACGAYAAHTFFSGLFHSSSLKLIAKNLGILVNRLLGRNDRVVKSFEELLNIPTSPEHKASYHMKLANAYTAQGRIDRALLNVCFALELSGKKKRFLHPFDWLRDLSYLGKIVEEYHYSWDAISASPLKRVRRSVFAFNRGEYDTAIDEIDKAVVLSKGGLDFKVVKALELDAMGETDKASLQWKDILETFFEKYEVESYLEPIGAHKVYKVNFDNLIEDMLILKGGNEDELIDEKSNIIALKKKINEPFFDTIRPLAVSSYKNRFFLSELLVHGQRLTEAFHQSRNYDLFRKTARFLAFVHAVMPNEGESHDYVSYFASYLNRFDLPDRLKQSILETMPVFLNRFYDVPLVFDRDGHSDNWFEYDGKIILMDLSYRGLVPPEFDTTKLFNRGSFFARDAQGDEVKDKVLIEDYLGTYNGLVPNKRMREESEFLLSSLNATPYKALTCFLFALNRPEQIPLALAFIENAIHDIERIKQPRFSKHFSRSEMSQYATFQRNLRVLENLVA